MKSKKTRKNKGEKRVSKEILFFLFWALSKEKKKGGKRHSFLKGQIKNKINIRFFNLPNLKKCSTKKSGKKVRVNKKSPFFPEGLWRTVKKRGYPLFENHIFAPLHLNNLNT